MQNAQRFLKNLTFEQASIYIMGKLAQDNKTDAKIKDLINAYTKAFDIYTSQMGESYDADYVGHLFINEGIINQMDDMLEGNLTCNKNNYDAMLVVAEQVGCDQFHDSRLCVITDCLPEKICALADIKDEQVKDVLNNEQVLNFAAGIKLEGEQSFEE